MTSPIVISIFLRGGMDFLSWCSPVKDTYYSFARGALKIPRPDGSNGAEWLDNHFALPPAAAPLKSIWNAGQISFVHSVGVDLGEKVGSHFDAQRRFEVGDPDESVASGWLARAVNMLPLGSPATPLRAISHTPQLARTLSGAEKTVATADPATFALPTVGPRDSQHYTWQKLWLRETYRRSADPVREAGVSTVTALDTLESLSWGGTPLPSGPVGDALGAVVDLVQSGVEVQAMHIDYGGWDLHANLLPLGTAPGTMGAQMAHLADSLAGFHAAMAAAAVQRDYVVLCVSEFGRRIPANSSAGLDHGWGGGITIMANTGLNGARIVTGAWHPSSFAGFGLQLQEVNGDLRASVDFRDVLGEFLAKRLGFDSTQLATVFPGYLLNDRGLFV